MVQVKRTKRSRKSTQTKTPGIKLHCALRGHKGEINQIAWSHNGQKLASTSFDNTVRLWNSETGQEVDTLDVGSYTFSVAWSPDGRMLAFSAGGIVYIWKVSTGKSLKELEAFGFIDNVAWSPDSRMLASASRDNLARIWDIRTGRLLKVLEGHNDWVRSVAWSADGKVLASGSDDCTVRLWDTRTGKLLDTLATRIDEVHSVAWSPDGGVLACGGESGRVEIWDATDLGLIRYLEGHTKAVNSLTFSADGLLLASKALNNIIRLWRTDNWTAVARLRAASANDLTSISFHPKVLSLAAPSEKRKVINVWDLNFEELIRKTSGIPITQYTSAKIVLIGESNVGKSCLAMRLAENKYPNDDEHGTTHGMRFWMMEPEKLSPSSVAPPGERRDVVLWDMGGQGEYRLVHQLFLHDTTLALILFDPTRGQTAFEEVEAWNKRLDKQLGERKAVKLLIGAKVDESSSVIDYAGIERLIRDCNCVDYFETSAKNGNGIPQLRQAIAAAINWESLAKTSRLELFQHIRDEVERRRQSNEVVVLLNDLEKDIRETHPELYEDGAVAAIAEQLATQGVIADTRLASGERMLVLRVEKVEQYAGSLIVAARNNERGVPALETRHIASPDLFLPGLKEEHRLPRFHERIVLESVVQLLVEHGVCFEHEGLLIFPSLFRATERDAHQRLPHSVSLYYDFSGAVDNIYASLIAWLVISKGFGRLRLWEDRAEFEVSNRGACGVRKVERGRGFAHIDVYFERQTPPEVKELFTSFVEDHLRRHDVDVAEHIEMVCPSCGYEFVEEDIRERIARGQADIGCVKCDLRVELATGVTKARQRDPMLERRTVALRTKVEIVVKNVANSAKQFFRQTDEELQTAVPLRILHLSDLHFSESDDAKTKLRPLIADIKDKDGGLGFDQLDYLVVSGDISNHAKPEEFEVAQQFISGIIREFELNAQRCIIVPGNHDLSWDEKVYEWETERRASIEKLKKEQYLKQGDGYLIRDELRYPNRFKNFSESFHHPLLQLQYPLTFEEQGLPYLFEDTGLQFLTFNSCWEIDEQFPHRSSIHSGALVRGLEKADEQVAKQMGKGATALRIAVWHHPITGNEKIEKEAFVQQLKQANVRVVLHGHVHETRSDLIGYPFNKHMHVAGAGSFGAPACHRPESMPRLYNLLEVSRDHKEIKVHTRCLRTDEGAWEGWAVWQGIEPTDKRTFYSINL